jgi:quinol monooxygenase YgiN
MIIVTGQVRFGDGEIARLNGDFAANIAATRAEPGCTSYHYSVDALDPNLLHVAEQWESEAAIDAHMQSPHMAALGAALGTAKIEAMKVDAWRADYLKTLMGG